MSVRMRAKVYVTSIETHNPQCETVHFTPAAKSGGYPNDGSDEDNTYAHFSPSGHFKLMIANPNLVGRFKLNDKFYVDFTPIEG